MSPKPQTSKPGNASASREDRLKAALKANLARRKQQARAKAGDKAQAGNAEAGKDKEN